MTQHDNAAGDQQRGTDDAVDRAVVPISVAARSWRQLHADLGRRGEGRRESGAFLLARPGQRHVRAWVSFDDLDPDCLVGAISFAPIGFSRLWDICAHHRLAVVADVHTHPGSRVDQSRIDATNPMIATSGHIALISPHYAAYVPRVEQVGVHVLVGQGKWIVLPPQQRPKVLRLRRFARPAHAVTTNHQADHSQKRGSS